jgi:hypothetical protein
MNEGTNDTKGHVQKIQAFRDVTLGCWVRDSQRLEET